MHHHLGDRNGSQRHQGRNGEAAYAAANGKTELDRALGPDLLKLSDAQIYPIKYASSSMSHSSQQHPQRLANAIERLARTNLTHAVSYGRMCLKAYPHSLDILNALAWIFYNDGRLEPARILVTEMLKLNTEFQPAKLLTGRLAQAYGERARQLERREAITRQLESGNRRTAVARQAFTAGAWAAVHK